MNVQRTMYHKLRPFIVQREGAVALGMLPLAAGLPLVNTESLAINNIEKVAVPDQCWLHQNVLTLLTVRGVVTEGFYTV